MVTFTIRDAQVIDGPEIFHIISGIAREGESFAMDVPADEETSLADWMTALPGRTVVAVDADGHVLGTANMYANRAAQGSHVASGSFMVGVESRGRGVGRTLLRDMLEWAMNTGFRAVQFNAVADTNVAAVELYLSEGFEVVGTAPRAFRHPRHGFVGLHIMWKDLSS